MTTINYELSMRRGLYKIHAFDSELVRSVFLESPPDVLYHYTDMHGLVGILDSCQIWATDSRFLNDTSEGSHAIKVIKSGLKRLQSLNLESVTQSNLAIIDHTIDEFERLTTTAALDTPYGRFFVTSFSCSIDSMYEWRAYGAGGKGAALGFKFIQPGEILPKVPDQIFSRNASWLLRCIYDEELQLKIIEDLYRLALRWWEYLSKEGYEKYDETTAPADLARGLAPTLLFLAPAFKRKEFQIENEWRLVRTNVPLEEDCVFVRVDSNGIKPYCKTDITKIPFVNIGPISVGNLSEFELTKVAISDLLKKRGLPPTIQVERSSLGLRY